MLAVVDQGRSSVLLCKRKTRADNEGEFSLVGGRMDHGDRTIISAIQRLKNEQLGEACRLRLLTTLSANQFVHRRDGHQIVVPYYWAMHSDGPITLSDEFAEHIWSPVSGPQPVEQGEHDLVEILRSLDRAVTMADVQDFVDV